LLKRDDQVLKRVSRTRNDERRGGEMGGEAPEPSRAAAEVVVDEI